MTTRPETPVVSERDAVLRTLRVPRDAKSFDVPASEAGGFGVDPGLLERLLAAGLPHRGGPKHPFFDESDLASLALCLRLPTAPRRATQWWGRSLRRPVTGRRLSFPMTVTVRCPEPGHEGDCAVEPHPLLAAAAAPGSLGVTGPGRIALDVVVDDFAGTAPDEVRSALKPVRALVFQVLPPSLREDLDFCRDTGLANCDLATRLAVRYGAEAGLEVRQAYGYFVTPPFVALHTWPEVCHDGSWVPYDPFMLSAMHEWGIPGMDDWPAFRTTSPLLWRCFVDGPEAPTFSTFQPVVHAGTPMSATMMVKERPR